jgi:pSer/pThr/pTyr-binding forkhead associated (FHA) protein
MADPRLNSLHLEPVRRQDYRRAREVLLQARGNQTVHAEHAEEPDPPSFSHTLIQAPAAAAPDGLTCWLADGEFIYPLKVGVNTFGRSSDNDIVVEDAFVSRRHCAILVHVNKVCELHDTASKNGTYLNGVRLTGPTRLSSGDEIRVSNQRYTFLTRQGADAIPSHATRSA